MFTTLITIAHVSVCVILIGIVLLQQGKGADMGATFGGGSQTVFGASGADNLLTRVTTTLAFLFMLSSIVLATGAQKKVSDDGSLFKGSAPATESSAPAETSAPAAASAPAGAVSEEAAKVDAPAETAAPAEASQAPAAEAPAAGN